MIESLVKYIQDKGYEVVVYPGHLVISKQNYHISWGITKHGFALYNEEFLYNLADECMNKIEKAINTKQGSFTK